MKDLIFGTILFFVGFSFGVVNCKAQTIYYTGSYGQLVGVANTIGNQTYYSNNYGQLMGVASVAPATVTQPLMQNEITKAAMPTSPNIVPLMPLMPIYSR